MTDYLNQYIQGLLSNNKSSGLASNMNQQSQQQLGEALQAKNKIQSTTDSLAATINQQANSALQQQKAQESALGNFIMKMGMDYLTGGLGSTATGATNPSFFLKT